MMAQRIGGFANTVYHNWLTAAFYRLVGVLHGACGHTLPGNILKNAMQTQIRKPEQWTEST